MQEAGNDITGIIIDNIKAADPDGNSFILNPIELRIVDSSDSSASVTAEDQSSVNALATIKGITFGHLSYDSLMACDGIDILSGMGSLEIVSFEASYLTEAFISMGTMQAFDKEFKESFAAFDRNGRLYIDNVKARDKQGNTYRLNSIVIKLF